MKRVLTIMTAVLLVAGAVATMSAQMKEHVVSADSVKFTPLDPKQPQGIQTAVISGELFGKGPVTFFMKLPKGPAPLHSHTAGYHAVLIRGQAKHWPAAQDGAKAPTLGPGSHWYQPGKANHGDECLSADCLLVLQFEGPFDFVPAKK